MKNWAERHTLLFGIIAFVAYSVLGVVIGKYFGRAWMGAFYAAIPAFCIGHLSGRDTSGNGKYQIAMLVVLVLVVIIGQWSPATSNRDELGLATKRVNGAMYTADYLEERLRAKGITDIDTLRILDDVRGQLGDALMYLENVKP